MEGLLFSIGFMWWCGSVAWSSLQRVALGLAAGHPACSCHTCSMGVAWGREWQPGPVPAPALGVSPCLSQGQAGLGGAGPAGTWLGHRLIALGADMGGCGDGPAAQALKFGFWVKKAKGWLACG